MDTAGEASAAQEYFAAVEECFSRLRGRPLLLAPRDVARVKAWHDSGVPLRVVDKALQQFFEREARRRTPRRLAPSLEYCERDVLELWEEWKAARLGAGDEDPGAASGGGADDLLREQLRAIAGRLLAARGQAQAEGRTRLAGAIGRASKLVAERAAQAGPLDAGSLEEELARAERKLIDAGRRALGESEEKRLTEAVDREVKGYAGGMEARAFEVLQRKARERAILAHFQLPRVALFTF